MRSTKKSFIYAEKIRNKKMKKLAISFLIILTIFIQACIFLSCESQTKKFNRKNYSSEVLMHEFAKQISDKGLNPMNYRKAIFADLSIVIEKWKSNPGNRALYELNIYKVLKSLNYDQRGYLEAYYKMLLQMNSDNKYREFTKLIKARLDEMKL